MATPAQIQKRVTDYYKELYPDSTPQTTFKSIGRTQLQVEDDGEELAIELNCDPDRSAIYGCASIDALIALLVKTRRATKGVMFEAATVGLRASRVLYPKR